MAEFQNWFGMVPHETDDYVSWRDEQPKLIAEKLRESYDAIALAHPELKAQLKFLLSEAYNRGYDQGVEDDSYDHGCDSSL